MTAGVLHDHQNMEKPQSGCMAGFLQIFDRHQFLAGKRVYATTKRLSPSPSSVTNTEKPKDNKEEQQPEEVQSSPECVKPEMVTPASPTTTNAAFKMPSTWKFRETPRLSLDSRAITDAKGSLYPREIRTTSAMLDSTSEDENDKQRRSPSVVARLMGLEALPESITREPLKKQLPELTRSASESRSRDFLRFVDVNNFHHHRSEAKPLHPIELKKLTKAEHFPEAKQKESLYGELEKRLKTRGVNEGAEDLETLKHILEALQLKGLLHSRKRHEHITNHRNFVFDESPSVVKKSSKTPPHRSKAGNRRNINVRNHPQCDEDKTGH